MKNILILMILVVLNFSSISSAQMAPPEIYKLVLAENNHFRDWTHDELKDKIRLHQELINLNVCNGNESKLLPDLLQVNPNKNSLRIIGTTDKVVLVYKNGATFDMKSKAIPIHKISDSFSKSTVTVLNQLWKIPEGRRLIELMQKSIYTVTLAESTAPRFEIIGSSGVANFGFEEATAMQHFVTLRKSGEVRIPFAQFGAGGNIRFKPGFKMQNTESDNVKRDVPSAVILGHEMFHAFDGVRGLMDRRFVNGSSMEFIEVTEYRATYFENQIRKGLGRKYRKYYSGSVGETPNQSLLDKKGQPYLFPTPCL